MASSCLALLAELKLQVLDNLGGRDLHHLQKSSRIVMQLVLGEETRLVCQIAKQAAERLKDFVRHTVNYDSEISFLEALY